MKNLRNAWKMAESAMNEQNPVVLDEDLMSHISGGKNGKPGTGWIKTVSGECRKDGKSCWDLLKQAIEQTIIC